MDADRKKIIVGAALLVVAILLGLFFYLLRKPALVFFSHPRFSVPGDVEKNITEMKTNLEALTALKAASVAEEQVQLESSLKKTVEQAKVSAHEAEKRLPDTRLQTQSMPGGIFDFNPR